MNERELLREYGIVRVRGYTRRGSPLCLAKVSDLVEWVTLYRRVRVRTHYRASPGTGPLGEP